MLLLLLLVTPLVNAYDDSWPSPCTCTVPQPLGTVNSIECLNGTWYGLYSTDGEWACYSVTYIDNGDNTMNTSVTETMENGCSQTIVTYYGTVSLNNNTLTIIFPCKPEWNDDLVIVATDWKTYLIYGYCDIGSCEPDYFIEFSSPNPSNCTMKKVKKDLNCLGLCLDNLTAIC